MTLCINPDIQFTDNVVGGPLYQGKLYFGVPNQDPKTNPKQPFSDPGLTVPISATQTLTDAGKPADTIYLGGDYSLTCDDQHGAQIFAIPSLGEDAIDTLRAELAASGGAAMIGYGTETVAEVLDQLTSPVIVIFSTGQSNCPDAIPFVWSPPPNLFRWNFDANSQPSNAVGTAFVAASATGIGPSMAAGAKLAWENPGARVLVINIYRGGMGIKQWGPSPDAPPTGYNFREAILGNVPTALAAAGVSKIDYFVWAGCEADANAQSQTIVFDMESWLWSWLVTQSWFQPSTPSYVLGMSPYAQSAPGNLDYLWRRYNGALRGSCSIFPSWRTYVDYDEFPISLYDPGSAIPYIHRTGEGYYRAGEKLGRCMLDGIAEPIQRADNTDGLWTPTFDPAQFVNCTAVSVSYAYWTRTGNTITAHARLGVTVTTTALDTSFWMFVPVKAKTFPNNVTGVVTSAVRDAGVVLPLASQQSVQVFFNANGNGVKTMMVSFSYRVNHSDILPNSPPGTT